MSNYSRQGDICESLEAFIKLIEPLASKYDFEDIPKNGYRRFIFIIKKYIDRVNQPNIKTSRDEAINKSLGEMLIKLSTLMSDIFLTSKNISCHEYVTRLLSIENDHYESLIKSNWFYLPKNAAKRTIFYRITFHGISPDGRAFFDVNRKPRPSST